MSITVASGARRQAGLSPWLLAWAGFLLLTLLLWLGSDNWAWAVKYPRSWVLPWKTDVSIFMKWLINDATFGLFTFKEFTRSIAWLIDWPYTLAKGLLSDGFKIPLEGEDAFYQTPPLSWLALLIVVTFFAYRIKDRALALLVLLCFGYLAVFGQWASAMVDRKSVV